MRALGLFLVLVGCGESFTAGDKQALTPPGAGEAGEPSAGGPSTGGAETGGSSSGGRVEGGAGSGSMSGSGGNPSGGASISGGAGSGGMVDVGGAGMAGSGGEPWMPTRCVEHPALSVAVPGSFRIELTVSVGEAVPAVYSNKYRVRWWGAYDSECAPTRYTWENGYGQNASSSVVATVEPDTVRTPEGQQTHSVTIGQAPPGASVLDKTISVGFEGCGPGDLETDDYSQSDPTHVGIYADSGDGLGFVLVEGCEP